MKTIKYLFAAFSLMAMASCMDGNDGTGNKVNDLKPQMSFVNPIKPLNFVVICDLTCNNIEERDLVTESIYRRAKTIFELFLFGGSTVTFLQVSSDANAEPIYEFAMETDFETLAAYDAFFNGPNNPSEILKSKMTSPEFQERDINAANTCLEMPINRAINIFKARPKSEKALVIISDFMEYCQASEFNRKMMSFRTMKGLNEAKDSLATMKSEQHFKDVKIWLSPIQLNWLPASKFEMKNRPLQNDITAFWKAYLVKMGAKPEEIYNHTSMPQAFEDWK